MKRVKDVVSIMSFVAMSCSSPEEEKKIAYERIKDENYAEINKVYRKLDSLSSNLRDLYADSSVAARSGINNILGHILVNCFRREVPKDEKKYLDIFIGIILKKDGYSAFPPEIQLISKNISNQVIGSAASPSTRKELEKVKASILNLMKCYYDFVMRRLAQEIISKHDFTSESYNISNSEHDDE